VLTVEAHQDLSPRGTRRGHGLRSRMRRLESCRRHLQHGAKRPAADPATIPDVIARLVCHLGSDPGVWPGRGPFLMRGYSPPRLGSSCARPRLAALAPPAPPRLVSTPPMPSLVGTPRHRADRTHFKAVLVPLQTGAGPKSATLPDCTRFAPGKSLPWRRPAVIWSSRRREPADRPRACPPPLRLPPLRFPPSGADAGS